MFSACFIFIYIFASSENLASHDFVSVEYSAVPLCTLIIPYNVTSGKADAVMYVKWYFTEMGRVPVLVGFNILIWHGC